MFIEFLEHTKYKSNTSYREIWKNIHQGKSKKTPKKTRMDYNVNRIGPSTEACETL